MPRKDSQAYDIGMKLLALIVGMLITLAQPVAAQDWDYGFAAYNRGHYTEAIKQWTPLSNQGNADAHYGLARVYYGGKGVLQNFRKALMYFRKAAVQNHRPSQWMIAEMYRQGQGVLTWDSGVAYVWYTLVSSNGHKLAKKHIRRYTDKHNFDINCAQTIALECLKNLVNCPGIKPTKGLRICTNHQRDP